ncbi:MAG: hypothetical protein LUC98_07530 [Lachnospiraceae bacterium]|nr:hypothetical protein [Lachnospiraceae bacterium]
MHVFLVSRPAFGRAYLLTRFVMLNGAKFWKNCAQIEVEDFAGKSVHALERVKEIGREVLVIRIGKTKEISDLHFCPGMGIIGGYYKRQFCKGIRIL